MLDAPEFARWQHAADDALLGAEAQRDAALAQWACFLAEQSAQLALKGLLHGVGEGAWGHDLVDLGDRVAAALGAALPSDLVVSLRRLSRHYIPARYPDAHPSGAPGSHYGPEDAEEAITDAQRVLGSAREAWRQLHDVAERSDEDQA